MDTNTPKPPARNVDPSGIVRYEFDSVSHYVELGVSTHTDSYRNYTANVRYTERQQNDRECSHFTNYNTIHTILEKLTNPPQDIVEEIESIKRDIEDKLEIPKGPRRTRRYKLDQGDELSADAWIQRNPEGWSDMTREHKPKNLIRIGMNMGAQYDRTQENQLYRGACVVALADILTTMGYSVEVTIFRYGHKNSEMDARQIQIIPAKPASAPLDVGTLAVCCCDVGFYRTVGFCVHGKVAPDHTGTGGSECLPREYKVGYDIVMDYDITSRDAAIQYVQDRMGEIKRNEVY